VSNRGYFRWKTKDAKLYVKLQEILERFITPERLKEVAHGMDTQCNESFNNMFSWLAPKNKVYCGTQSLRNRLSASASEFMLWVVLLNTSRECTGN
jgi:hypothetical protein